MAQFKITLKQPYNSNFLLLFYLIDVKRLVIIICEYGGMFIVID
jgi:hypothetical protein